MDKNTITGLVLIFAIFIGFSFYNNHKKTKSFDSIIAVADSLYDVQAYQQAKTEYMRALQYKAGDPTTVEKVNELNTILAPVERLETQANTIEQNQPEESLVTSNIVGTAEPESYDYLGDFSDSGNGELSFVTLRNNKLEIKISNKGGRPYKTEMLEYKTHDGQPLILFSGDSTIFGFKFFTADNKPIQTNNLFFEAQTSRDIVDASSSAGVVKFRLNAGENSFIEYTYTLEPDSYMLDFDVSFVGMNQKIASNLNSLSFDWQAYIKQQEKGRQNENAYSQH